MQSCSKDIDKQVPNVSFQCMRSKSVEYTTFMKLVLHFFELITTIHIVYTSYIPTVV